MSGCTPEEWRDLAWAGFASHTDGFLQLLATLSDEQAARPVPGLRWTAAETAAHVCSLYRRLTEDARRAPDPAGVAVRNAADIDAIGTDLAAIADEIRQRFETAQALVPLIPVDRTFPFHAGQAVTTASGLGVMIGELIAHGDDIARAAGASWTPPDDGLEVLWRLTLPVLQGWLTADAASVDRRWSFDFGWAGGPVVVRVDHGTVTTDRGSRSPHLRVDHHVAVEDPIELTLAFPYRRRPLDEPAVAELAHLFRTV